MDKKLKVYIAHRYSCKGKYLETFASIGRAVKMGIEVVKLGYVPFVPHCDVLMSNGDLPLVYYYDAYYDASLEWLKVCDCLFLIDPNDLLTSEGVRTEYNYAIEHGIKVIRNLEDLKDV